LSASRMRIRRWKMSLAWAASIAVLLTLGVWFFGPTMGQPMLAQAQGGDVMIERGTEFIRASSKMPLRANDVLRTGTNGVALITFGKEKTRLQVGAATELKVASFARGKRLELHLGTIEAVVARQRPFAPMVIMTPQAQVRVLGTSFILATDTNATTLEVTKGKVKMTRISDRKMVKVGAGNRAVAAANYELAALPVTGHILYEYWTNVSGLWDPAWDSKVSEHPDHVEYLALFEAAGKSEDNFGERIRGYVHPPKTGDYTFWIAGDGFARFALSRDDQPRNKVRLATSQGTKKQPREWTNQPKQQSSTVTLTAGRKYYIEAVQNDAGKGEHHLAVAWQGPDREREVIPGEFLSAFENENKPKKGK